MNKLLDGIDILSRAFFIGLGLMTISTIKLLFNNFYRAPPK